MQLSKEYLDHHAILHSSAVGHFNGREQTPHSLQAVGPPLLNGGNKPSLVCLVCLDDVSYDMHVQHLIQLLVEIKSEELARKTITARHLRYQLLQRCPCPITEPAT